MRKYSFKSIMGIVAAVALSFFLVTQASAMVPTLSLVSNSYGQLQVTVYGDANSPVILDYYSGNQLMGAGIIGYTNYSGSFSSTINSNNYTIPNGAQVIVMVNGQQSSPVLWQNNGYNNYPNNGYGTTPILSQANVVLSVGQSQIITVSNGGGYYNNNQYYISNGGNNIATATVNGSQITLYGQTAGTTTLSVCSNNNYNNGYNYNNGGCATLYVTVNSNNNYYPPTYYPPYPTYSNYPLTVSNSNVQLTVGNTTAVTVYGNTTGNNYPYNYNNGYYNNSNNFYITNGNSNIATATFNGNTLTIYATAPGSTTITICQSGTNQCTTIYITVTSPIYIYNQQYYYPPQGNNGWYYSNAQHCWLHY